MIGMPAGAIGVYVFLRGEAQPSAQAAGEALPIRYEQIGGLLSAVGGFRDAGIPADPIRAVTRIRYDGLEIVGIRGAQGVVAAVYPGGADASQVDGLNRLLGRIDKAPAGASRPRRTSTTPSINPWSRLSRMLSRGAAIPR